MLLSCQCHYSLMINAFLLLMEEIHCVPGHFSFAMIIFMNFCLFQHFFCIKWLTFDIFLLLYFRKMQNFKDVFVDFSPVTVVVCCNWWLTGAEQPSKPTVHSFKTEASEDFQMIHLPASLIEYTNIWQLGKTFVFLF